MDFLNHRVGGKIYRFTSFLLYNVEKLNCRNCKRLREFEKINIFGKAVEVTVNNKEENS